MKSSLIVITVAIAPLVGGCAGIAHRALTDVENETAKGLRYYDSSPYLLVQTDNDGGLKSELVYLPDQTKRREAKPYTFLATNNTTLEFVKGVVTTTTSETDSTAVPAAVVQALQKVASEAVKLARFDAVEGEASGRVPQVYLFKIVKEDVIEKGERRRAWGLIGASGGTVAF